MSFWPVAALVGVIAGLSLVIGHWTAGVFMSLLALLLLAAIFPPLAALVAAAVIVYLIFTHGPALFQQANQLVGGKA